MSNLQFSLIGDWRLGRLDDDEYLPAVFIATLTLLIGATKGEVAAQAEEMLTRFHATGELPEFPKPTGRTASSERGD